MAIDFKIGTDYKTDTGLKVTCIFIGTKFVTFVTPEGQSIDVPLGEDSVLQPIGTSAQTIVSEFKPGTQHDGYVPMNKGTGWGTTIFDTFEEAKQSNAGAILIAHLFFDEDTQKAFAELLDPESGKVI